MRNVPEVAKGVAEGGVLFEGADLGARHHRVADRLLVQLEDAADHLGLLGIEHPVLLARLEDHPDLLDAHREVALAVAPEVALTRKAQQQVGGPLHHRDERTEGEVHDVDEAPDPQAQRLGAVEGEDLRGQLTADDVDERHHGEPDDVADRVGSGVQRVVVAQSGEDRHHPGVDDRMQRLHADGAQPERDEGDADLGDRVEPFGLLVEQLDGLGPAVTLLRELPDATSAGGGDGDL